MITPRPYQIKALEKIYHDLKSMPEVLLMAIMGAGKTFISARLVQRLYRENPGMQFLILMHKQELVEQFYSAFQEFTGIPFRHVGVCCAGLNQKQLDRQITIATIQTFINQMEKYSGAGLIVIDEAHRIDINGDTQYKQVLEYLRMQRPNCRILGLTATPSRLGHGYCYGYKCKPGNINLFPELNHTITYDELMQAGFLVPLKGIVAKHDSLERDLAGVSVNGDYVINQLGEIMTNERHMHTAVEAIEKYCHGYKRICVFCCTIDHAEQLKTLIGEQATTVHSQLSSLERQSNMAAWESGKKPIMTSVNILTEGFDMPVLDCLVFARPTLSSTLYLQAVGRVLRTHDEKDHGLLVDLTDNTARFGTDLDNVKVSVPKAVEAQEKKEKAMFKLCPQCECEVHIALRECSECGFQWPEQECIIAEALPDMEEVVFIKSPPEWVDVEEFEGSIHTSKKSEKQLGRIQFFFKETEYKLSQVSMWLCFPDNYSGFAVEKSKEKWSQISPDPFPETVDGFFAARLYQPDKILIDRNGKYPELIEVEANEESLLEYETYDDEVPF